MVKINKRGKIRQAICEEAARLICDQGILDYAQAKTRAAERLGHRHLQSLPRNSEIHSAVARYQKLFRAGSHSQELKARRKIALDAMNFLDEFKPKLIGSTWDGTAVEHSAIQLHLFAQEIQDVIWHLQEHALPWEQLQRQVRYVSDAYETIPVLSFRANDYLLELYVFDYNDIKRKPLCPISGKAIIRASLNELIQLIDSPRTDGCNVEF